ncbi:hypothetical protein L486_00013 [Kwoniella mangroviensis CBS 10435]|uniref:SANT domain-containing protein n=1 Tax=Kwoniella mangroviensis CBS 10435 TaxID=1331196 RepID=A0A1B9IXX5_9TREE|nr:hypothetical protein L486_00013 [Kwoniella mangroviensis CBS 10435]
MYPEAGPSRPSSSSTTYPGNSSIKLPPAPSGSGNGLPPRVSRWDGEYERERDRERDERIGGGYPPSSSSSSSRPYAIPPWQNRAPRPGGSNVYRPHSSSGSGPGSRPRSLTPSPPRRILYERERERERERDRDREREWDRERDRFDVRDRLSLDSPGAPYRSSNGPDGLPPRRVSGYAPPPRDRESNWSSRWRDDRYSPRERERDRDDHRSSAPSRYPLPPPAPRSPPSAPRGPRSGSASASTAQTPPSYSSRLPSTSGPNRSTHYTPNRDSFTSRQFDRSVSVGGTASGTGGPSTSRPVSPSLSAAGAQSRMRGSSSPVESKRTRDTDGPSSVPTSQIPLPDVKLPAEEHDLEEGEVISPVQATRVPSWSYDERSRRNFTPPRDRERDRWDRDGARERDRDRRPLSPPLSSSTFSTRRNLDDTWTNNNKNRKRSSSNPPARWNEEVDRGQELSSSVSMPSQRSPRKSIGQPEEGEVATVQSVLDNQKQKEDEEEEKKVDRPPTPPVPPPTTQSDHLDSTLDVQDIPSRPDTPSLPPPPADQPPSSSLPVSRSVSVPESNGQTTETKMDVEVEPVRPISANDKENTEVDVQTEQTRSDGEANMTAQVSENDASGDNAIRNDISSIKAGQQGKQKDRPHVEVEEQDIERSQDTADTPMEVDDPLVPESTPSKESPVKEGEERILTSPQQALPNGHVDIIAPLDNETAPVMSEDTGNHIAQTDPTSPVPAPLTRSLPKEAAIDSASPIQETSSVPETVPFEDQPNLASTIAVSHDKVEYAVVQVVSPATITSDKVAIPETPASPPARRVTIAERRAVQLPSTNGPLSSPFGDGEPRKDPMPTAYSTSTEAETEAGPRTADIDEADTPIFEDAPEETKQANLIAAIKTRQTKQTLTFDPVSIIAWNVSAAPTHSSRIIAKSDKDRSVMLKKTTWPLSRQQRIVAKLVASTLSREKEDLAAKSERLKNEYLELDQEWQEHCNFLDSLMEKRGEVPADLYAVPGALPVVTPGPVAPTTPLPEDLYNARGNRRRGAGDAVHTEAEFEAILAGLADTAAKDPTYRANKTSAVVPDMLLDEERRLRYDDDNDLVEDPLAFYDFKGNAEPIWTTEERAIFVRRYMAYPKQFGRIADGIPNKSASDCVLYYYRTKKEVDYKGMLASKRGGGKKKTMPIKKGGKSSALLADMDRQIPTVSNEVNTPGRGGREREESVIPGTSARKGKTVGTPAEGNGPGRRRKTTAPSIASTANDDDEKLDSNVTSRAGSEAPSTVGSKAKMRVTMKTAKRPRVSSISVINPTRPSVPSTPSARAVVDPMTSIPTAPVTAAMSTPGPAPVTAIAGATPTNESLDPTTAQSELLPPVKRAGKRRKVLAEPSEGAVDPNATPVANSISTPGATPTGTGATEKPTRRSATNSYWSVEEKRRVKELVLVHGADVKAIAAELKGKSERQVGNFLEGHRSELVDGNGAPLPPLNLGGIKAEEDKRSLTGRVSPVASLSGSETFRSAQPTRTIYDAYPSFMSQDRYEPRLGMFPPSPPHAPASATPTIQSGGVPDSSPLKPVSRSGGMRISALLNDDAPAPSSIVDRRPSTAHSNPDTIDAASDGTVDERDLDGMTRPSPRSVAPVPASAASYGRYDQRPDLDRYRSSSSLPAPSPYPSNTTSWSNGTSRNDIYSHRAATTTPVPVSSLTHRPSWSDTNAHHSPHAVPPVTAPVVHRSNSYARAPNGNHDSSQHHHNHHHQHQHQHHGVSPYPPDRSYARDYPHHHHHHHHQQQHHDQNSLPPLKSTVGPPPLMGPGNHTHTSNHGNSGASTHRTYE